MSDYLLAQGRLLTLSPCTYYCIVKIIAKRVCDTNCAHLGFNFSSFFTVLWWPSRKMGSKTVKGLANLTEKMFAEGVIKDVKVEGLWVHVLRTMHFLTGRLG